MRLGPNIDSAAGGASTISQAAGFTDAADSNRHAITAVDANNAARALNLPIAADFAIALSPLTQPVTSTLVALTVGQTFSIDRNHGDERLLIVEVGNTDLHL